MQMSARRLLQRSDLTELLQLSNDKIQWLIDTHQIHTPRLCGDRTTDFGALLSVMAFYTEASGDEHAHRVLSTLTRSCRITHEVYATYLAILHFGPTTAETKRLLSGLGEPTPIHVRMLERQPRQCLHRTSVKVRPIERVQEKLDRIPLLAPEIVIAGITIPPKKKSGASRARF